MSKCLDTVQIFAEEWAASWIVCICESPKRSYLFIYELLTSKLDSSRIRKIFTLNTTKSFTDFFHYKDRTEMDPH